MSKPTPPMPVPDADSEPFWSGCREHRLRLQHCAACDKPRYPPRRHCAACGSDDSVWKDASGKGKVYSWIVVNHPVPRDVYADKVPYVVALVDLAEGVRMATNIVDLPPHAVEADMPVEVTFAEVAGAVLPLFRPSAHSE